MCNSGCRNVTRWVDITSPQRVHYNLSGQVVRWLLCYVANDDRNRLHPITFVKDKWNKYSSPQIEPSLPILLHSGMLTVAENAFANHIGIKRACSKAPIKTIKWPSISLKVNWEYKIQQQNPIVSNKIACNFDMKRNMQFQLCHLWLDHHTHDLVVSHWLLLQTST